MNNGGPAIRKDAVRAIENCRASIHDKSGKRAAGYRKGGNAVPAIARHNAVAHLNDNRSRACGASGKNALVAVLLHRDPVEHDPRRGKSRWPDCDTERETVDAAILDVKLVAVLESNASVSRSKSVHRQTPKGDDSDGRVDIDAGTEGSPDAPVGAGAVNRDRLGDGQLAEVGRIDALDDASGVRRRVGNLKSAARFLTSTCYTKPSDARHPSLRDSLGRRCV